MAKNFEWDYDAAGDLMLRSQEIADVCEKEAARITRAAGVEYRSDVRVGRTRVNARGYDKMSGEKGVYKKRKGGKLVYTEYKLEG